MLTCFASPHSSTSITNPLLFIAPYLRWSVTLFTQLETSCAISMGTRSSKCKTNILINKKRPFDLKMQKYPGYILTAGTQKWQKQAQEQPKICINRFGLPNQGWVHLCTKKPKEGVICYLLKCTCKNADIIGFSMSDSYCQPTINN